MLVAKPEWICSRLVTRAASQPLFDDRDALREARAIAPVADVAATTTPSWMSSMPIDDRLRGRRRRPGPRPFRRRGPSWMTSPGPQPSTSRSTNDPDDTNVRPARTASAQASNEIGDAGVQAGVRPDGAERDLGRHLVRAADDRQPVAAVEEAVPLADRRPVDVGGEGLHLDRVDLARRRCRRRPRRRATGSGRRGPARPARGRHRPSRRSGRSAGRPGGPPGRRRWPSAGRRPTRRAGRCGRACSGGSRCP